jgi:hypothetical protein
MMRVTTQQPKPAETWAFRATGATGKPHQTPTYVPPTVHYSKVHVWEALAPDGRMTRVRVEVDADRDVRELARVRGGRALRVHPDDVRVRYSHTVDAPEAPK